MIVSCPTNPGVNVETLTAGELDQLAQYNGIIIFVYFLISYNKLYYSDQHNHAPCECFLVALYTHRRHRLYESMSLYLLKS